MTSATRFTMRNNGVMDRRSLRLVEFLFLGVFELGGHDRHFKVLYLRSINHLTIDLQRLYKTGIRINMA